MEWHMRIGYAILTLLLFRVVWGIIGSDSARFVRFLKSPAAALRHLYHLRQREADKEVGHNAAGGWMVLLMLALLGVQAGTGLFANDDSATDGPLMHLIDKDQSNFISKIHSLNFNLILAVIVLHVVAIAAYAVLKRQNLVRPMVTGTKLMPGDTAAPRLVSPIWAAVTLAAAAAAVAWLINL
jgi:cytochrome b